jgi:hypothetical protein
LTHLPVNRLQIACRQQSLGDTPLIADNQDAQARLREQGDRFGDTRKKLHIFPTDYVLTFRRLAIDNSVTIQKCGPLHGKYPGTFNLTSRDQVAELGA